MGRVFVMRPDQLFRYAGKLRRIEGERLCLMLAGERRDEIRSLRSRD